MADPKKISKGTSDTPSLVDSILKGEGFGNLLDFLDDSNPELETAILSSMVEKVGSDEERKQIYQDLADAALSGIPLNQVELFTLSLGIHHDDPSVRPFVLDTLIPQLERIEANNPGATQVDNLRDAPTGQALTGFAPIPGFGALRGVAGLAGKVSGFAGRHPKSAIATGVGVATLLGYGLNTEGTANLYAGEVNEPLYAGEVNEPPRDPFFTVNSATGRTVKTTAPDATDDGIYTGGYSPDLIALAELNDVDPSEMAEYYTSDAVKYGTLNDLYFGEIRLPLDNFPYGASVTGEAIRPDASGKQPATRSLPMNERLRELLPQEDFEAIAAYRTVVPPGGQINPQAFQEYGDNTLLDLIARAADSAQIPVELLYGIINAQSGFIINAMTPDGSRVGLGQIDLEDSYVTRTQALNPKFAINWVAQQLQIGIGRYGSFEGGVVSLFDPEEAKFLSEQGEFNNPYAKAFVSDVFEFGRSSGIGKYLLDPNQVPDARSRGSGRGAGPKIPPYQAKDPATLREIVRLTYEDLLSRGATEDESTTEVGNLGNLFKEQYNAQVAQIQGKASTAVDPQARFEEGIRSSGEFGFREETRDVRDAMSFMSEIVRIMEGV